MPGGFDFSPVGFKNGTQIRKGAMADREQPLTLIDHVYD
jgi:hypothetical protein